VEAVSVSKAELERLWEWSGAIIEELEELRATIAGLYDDEEDEN
jgi:hypothetical protein